MNKNDYRRAFIMLRPAASGYSGHVRLERRTMTGSMYFIAAAPDADAALSAALVGQRAGSFYAASLGALRRDARGQYTLAWPFDPRAIDGRPLEAYQLIAVARTDRDACRVVLTGNVDGAYPMDDAAVRDAVCALFLADLPAADLPGPDEPDAGGAPEPSEAAPPEMPIALPDPAELIPALEAQDPAAVADQTPLVLPANADAQSEAGPDAAEVPPEPAGGARIFTRMRAVERIEPVEPEPLAEAPDPEGERLGAARADLAPTWRALSGTDTATPCAMPLEDGYAYVRVPLPAACGFGYCLLGVRVDGGRVASVRVALPGAYAAAPPEGLEGSVWLGAGDAGFWVRTVSCDER